MAFLLLSRFQSTVQIGYDEFGTEVGYKRVWLYRTRSSSKQITLNPAVCYNRV